LILPKFHNHIFYINFGFVLESRYTTNYNLYGKDD